MTERTEPEVGQVWRERDDRRSKRLVKVVSLDQYPWGKPYVSVETVRTAHGHAPVRPIRTRVSRRLWHERFEYVGQS